jgi:hypothetical protein
MRLFFFFWRTESGQKIGHQALKGEFFKVTANRNQPSEIMRNQKVIDAARRAIANGNREIHAVAETIKRKDIDAYRDRYEKQQK